MDDSVKQKILGKLMDLLSLMPDEDKLDGGLDEATEDGGLGKPPGMSDGGELAKDPKLEMLSIEAKPEDKLKGLV